MSFVLPPYESLQARVATSQYTMSSWNATWNDITSTTIFSLAGVHFGFFRSES